MSQSQTDHGRGAVQTMTQLSVALALTLVVLGAAFVVPGMFGLGFSVASNTDNSEEAIAARIQPIGAVKMMVVSAAAAARSGEEVFKARCAGCHEAGAMGSPKFGDAAAWGPRVAQGFEAMLNSALKGKNAMPAQGGGDLSEIEIARGVVYMANAGGAKFAEPKAPEGAASQAP